MISRKSNTRRPASSQPRQLMPEALEARTLFAVPTGFAQSTIGTGLSNPTSMAFAPDGSGRLFVTEQAGRVKIIGADGRMLGTDFLTVPTLDGEERGLLGLDFAPDFTTSREVFVYWTQVFPGVGVKNTVSRFVASAANPNIVEANSRQDIFLLPRNGGANHQGGAIHFGPDGKLYVAVGEHGNPSDAQSLATPFGKLLRLNRDGSIPTDNPFYNQTTAEARAIYAYGLRNPFTFAFHPDNSGRIFVNDVGAGDWEEIDDVKRGQNYGWPGTEGAFNPANFPTYTNPLGAYGSDGCAITGGTFYVAPEGAARPWPASYEGKYFFADYCRQYVKMFDPATAGTGTLPGGVVNLDSLPYFATQMAEHPVDIDVGPDGDLYVLSRAAESAGTGVVGRISYTASNAPSINQQPESQTITEGQQVTFAVTASGTAPLRYQWQRNGVNINGATAPSYRIDAVQAGDNGARYRAVVTNDQGSATSNEAILTVTVNRAPTGTITITSPSAGGRYAAGQTIGFSGAATDPEQGALPTSAFTWRVDFHHDTHSHPALPSTSGSTTGSYVVPTTGETAANVWYRVHLTVTDAGGLTHSSFVDVQPQTANITLTANVPGLTLTLDGQPRTAPHAFVGVAGLVRSIGAPAAQTLNGANYEFVSWSDGGAIDHFITTPATNTTFTATYRPLTLVIGRHVFYNNSSFDGRSPAANAADDAAIATDKQALLPGQAATFANYTSYANGINGIMLDVSNGGMPITADNFAFRVGNSNSPAGWSVAPGQVTVTRRNGAGSSGSDRITLTWPDRSIRNKWIEVTFRAAPGEPPRDVFFFGNAIGETGTNPANAFVNALDQANVRSRLRTVANDVANRYDFNRDGRVNVTDQKILRSNLASGARALALITPTTSSPDEAASAAVQEAPRSATLFSTRSVRPTRVGATSILFSR